MGVDVTEFEEEEIRTIWPGDDSDSSDSGSGSDSDASGSDVGSNSTDR
jgi:hypothetical protein